MLITHSRSNWIWSEEVHKQAEGKGEEKQRRLKLIFLIKNLSFKFSNRELCHKSTGPFSCIISIRFYLKTQVVENESAFDYSLSITSVKICSLMAKSNNYTCISNTVIMNKPAVRLGAIQITLTD